MLLDPHVVRMPVPSRGGWSWESRSAPDAWLSEPVATSTEVALTPVRAVEGWLRLVPQETP